MSILGIASRRWRLSFVLLAVVCGGSYAAYKSITKTEFIGVSLVGVHHLGSKYLIHDFVVDGYSGSNIGREGGGGGFVCCVALPKKWRPGITADVRWDLLYYADDASDVAKRAAMYRARVPVEKYDEPGDFWVHFFPNGRVRIVVSNDGPGPMHPIHEEDPRAAMNATAGVKIKTLFTDEELQAARKKDEKKRSLVGDWR